MRLGISRSAFLCLCGLALLLAVIMPLRAPAALASATISLPIKQDWYYRWSDLANDAEQALTWTRAPQLAADWQPFEFPSLLTPPSDQQTVWLAVRLPEIQTTHPSLHIQNAPYLLDMYLQERLIFVGGTVNAAGEWRHSEGYFPIVPLPPNYVGQLLFVRLHIHDQTRSPRS
ncbi:MAG: hypothetical protein HC838_11705 [Spirulinaceae cyanobacterium RM2_2_10]|nr:hypothetical protein [Spirulinaceae cyanobacterium RM2_2_10]